MPTQTNNLTATSSATDDKQNETFAGFFWFRLSGLFCTRTSLPHSSSPQFQHSLLLPDANSEKDKPLPCLLLPYLLSCSLMRTKRTLFNAALHSRFILPIRYIAAHSVLTLFLRYQPFCLTYLTQIRRRCRVFRGPRYSPTLGRITVKLSPPGFIALRRLQLPCAACPAAPIKTPKAHLQSRTLCFIASFVTRVMQPEHLTVVRRQ